jgi:glycosyltransferase involved in cell wall biosynthesis
VSRPLQVAGSLSARQGGPTTAALGLSTTLGSRVLSVDAYLGAPERDELRGRGVEVYPRLLSERLQFSPQLLLAVWRGAQSADIVIFHGLMLVNTVLGALICRVRRADFAIQLHGGLEPYQLQNHRWRKAVATGVFRYVLRSAKVVACASESEAAAARRYSGSDNVRVVGLGVPPVEGQRPRPRPRTPLVVGYMGRFATKKRLDLVVAGCRRLIDRGVEVRLVVAGADGDLTRADVQQMVAAAAPLDATVEGPVRGPEKRRFWDEIDVFLLPSDNENFGIVIAEAAASGVPVVATRHVAAHQVLLASGGGALCEQYPASIAEALSTLSDEAAYAEASARCLEVAGRDFSWPGVGQRWRQALEGAR